MGSSGEPILHEQFSLRSFNTFGVEARARYFVSVQSETELRAVLHDSALAHLPRFILGGGSNLLLTRDFPGLVIHMHIAGKALVRRDAQVAYVRAAAGENWHDFVLWTLDQGLPGLENLSLIPGTVGAAPIQNIGAYGVEMSETFHSLTALDVSSGASIAFEAPECEFGYRDSIFKHAWKDRALITSVLFSLPLGALPWTDYGELRTELTRLGIHRPTARDVSAAVIAIRRRKLPDPAKIGNAGSFFKNPIVTVETFDQLKNSHPTLPHYLASYNRIKLPAGWLIEQAGWKGRTLGRAGVHAAHALVLVNLGGASGAEIWTLAQRIQESIFEHFGVHLEPEPVIL
jgi:UDP-N-acetylmuramate dehydrogenase